MSPTTALGRVTEFDARRGLGRVTGIRPGSAEGVVFDFHATAISDGTRRIEPGSVVSFLVMPGQRGRYEARALSVIA